MSVDRFRFVSPGIFINEIDRSVIPVTTVPATGPAVIGRTSKGPALRPTTVRNFAEFVQLFGTPSAGGQGGDVWRNGNYTAPTYAAYAVQAYLANNSPVTFVRLLGGAHASATAAGAAGWSLQNPQSAVGGGQSDAEDNKGGVYGLWVCASGSAHGKASLLATWYLQPDVTIALSGGIAGKADGASDIPATTGQGDAMFVEPVTVGSKAEFKVVITSGSSVEKSTTFNFNEKSGRYIRKVFNTNPQLTNPNITSPSVRKGYWLGDSFERVCLDQVGSLDNFSNKFGVLLSLGSGSAINSANFKKSWRSPRTPPIVAQSKDVGSAATFTPNNQQELFTVVALDDAEYAERSYKISFSHIKQSPQPEFNAFGSFTLIVRELGDNDANPMILEQFDELNLNPNSPSYIARRIGDKQLSWSDTDNKYRSQGEYDNQSRYIRIEMNDAVANNWTDDDLLPFGFKGLPMYVGFNAVSGAEHNGDGFATFNVATAGTMGASATNGPDSLFSLGSGSVGSAPSAGGAQWLANSSSIAFGGCQGDTGALRLLTASFQYPLLPLRNSSSDNQMLKDNDAYFGMSVQKSSTSLIFDPSVRDHLRVRPATLFGADPNDKDQLQRGPGFSLDNLCGATPGGSSTWDRVFHSGTDGFNYLSGTQAQSGEPYFQGGYVDGNSITYLSSSYEAILDLNFNRFTVPLVGGFDGWDIMESEPVNNTRALGGVGNPATNARTNAIYYTCTKGINTVADSEVVDINLATIPGVWSRGVTDHLMRVCEARADAMAIIDLESGYTSSVENTESFANRKGDVSGTVGKLKDRSLNTSYAAAYYPWVQARDTVNGVRLWMPPSVVALGTYASSEQRSELWFAPAGFNRGGLSQGAAGIPVVGVLDKLTSSERDKLYEVSINPIASFPAEGIVVFGQKTLQASQSALDRINVRRLLIYLKKQISRIAATILFDPNIQVTWDRFLGRVEPLLRSVKSRYGLSDYRVILDNTTTTPELIDRNIMYAKVFLKPTRAIEFIALDFIITRTGASFDD